MRQKLLLTMLLLLSIVAPFAALADSFTIKPVELELGQSATLQFNLENTQAYYGFQADVTLPDGIEVKKVSLSDRAAGEAMFKLNSKTVSNGSLRIAAFSSNHNAFTENDGVLVNMEVTVANTYEGGDIEVSNIIFTDKDNQDVKLDPTSLTPDVKLTGLSFRRSDVSLNLDENETTTLVPIYTPEIATNKTVSWESSDESVATVSEKGEVTPLKVGTTDITATSSNGLIAKITVTVTTDVVSVTAISVSPTSLELTEGDTEKLTATITPTDATDKSVTWHSSNESIATVDENGNVDAIKVGTTTITVESSNGKTASCTVTVNAKIYLAESVTLNKETSELKVGETVKLTASVLPENTTNKTVTWTTSDATIATVEDGVVTAVAIGEATITATCGSVSATCEVSVVKTPVESVSLDKTNLSLTEGETGSLAATVAPDDATNKTVSWTSSNTAIATVDADGKVTAVAPGTATITVTTTDGNKTATCEVTVAAKVIEVTGVTLDKADATVTEGETVTLTATIEPADANTYTTLTWSSSDETIATVKEGVVTCVKAGTATITVTTANGKTASCSVTVTAKVIPVEGITLSETTATIIEGKSITLTATIEPTNATDINIIWSSSNEDVATVDENGKVTAVAVGTATITAKAGEHNATCAITVEENLIGASNANVKMTYVNMDEPDTEYGEIAAGETAKAGFNKISGGSVGFGNSGWGVNYITYLQVNVSDIEGTIIGATLSFEGSGSTDSKRTTTWGVGYNSSAWSADMSYNTADKSITAIGTTQTTSTKSAATFEKFSFDIIDAVKHADENGLVTVLVYETAAGGGYIKNPVVSVNWTKEPTYNVTFTETNGVKDVKVTVDDLDVTNGTSLLKGTYSFSATAPHYKDYTGNFTVAGEDLEVKFEMTQKDKWNYTVKNNVNDEVKTGNTYEWEPDTVAYSRYILADDGTLWKKDPCGGDKKLEYNYTFTPDSANYVVTLEYTATDIANAIHFAEAEDIKGMTATKNGNAGVRASGALGAYSADPVVVYTLNPGKYIITIANSGKENNTMTVKAGEETVLKATTTGSWKEFASEEFEVMSDTDLTFEGAADGYPLDYILIQKTGDYVPVSGITLSKNLTLEMGAEAKLTAKVNPSDATHENVTWTSSDENVVTIDGEGNVKALKVGSAVITATCYCGDETAECIVKVYPKLGDANYDGSIDITDAVDINNYVVGRKEVADEDMEYYVKAANANGDGEGLITVADASATVSIMLAQAPAESTQARISAYADESADALVIGDASVTSNGTIIPVGLDNSMDYVALQADIILPEGSNVEVKEGGRMADSHILMTRKHADNHIRIAIFNFRNEAIADNEAPVFEIVTDSNIAASDIVISSIIASDADANGYILGTKLSTTTGVAAIGFDGNAPVKVFDMNGIYVGDSMEGLGQGTYIIRQGEVSKKVYLR